MGIRHAGEFCIRELDADVGERRDDIVGGIPAKSGAQDSSRSLLLVSLMRSSPYRLKGRDLARPPAAKAAQTA